MIHLLLSLSLTSPIRTVRRPSCTLPPIVTLSLLHPHCDLVSELLQPVKVLLKVELLFNDLVKEQVEVIPEIHSLALVLAVDKLLHLSAEAIERAACLPSSHEITHDHFESETLLHSELQATMAHVDFERALNLGSHRVQELQVCLPLSLSLGFFSQLSFDLSLSV